MAFKFSLENPIQKPYDSSLMASLFLAESDHTPLLTSLHLSPIRIQIISLILQFCRKIDPFLSYLSINYLDRFLSTQHILETKPWILRLLAVSCVSLAMKMWDREFSLADFEHDDGGLLFDSETVKRMELMILGALKWRMRSITPFAFITFFISLFKFKDLPSTQALQSRATQIILSSQNDVKLLELKPSIISASALLTASHELFPLQFPCYQNSILDCSFLNKENFFKCYSLVEEIAMEGYESVLEEVVCSSSTSTPDNVLDLLAASSTSCCSESDVESPTHKTKAIATNYATATIAKSSRLENDVFKKRKINVLSE